MANWHDLESDAPALAAGVRAAFDTGKHKVMATLRADGSPRVSGTEVAFWEGDAWLGSMPGSRKAADLRRDPRLAIHSPTIDETLAGGDAKLGGRAVEITDPVRKAEWAAGHAEEVGQAAPEPFQLFRIEIDEAVLTRVAGDHLVIESWRPGQGTRRVERR